MGINRPIMILLAVTLITVMAVFALRAYHLNTYTIPSASMEPTLQVGDRVEIDPDAYQTTEPQRGDVVVFDGSGSFYAYDSETPMKRFRDNVLGLVGMAPKDHAVVKRVIATDGDTVECCDTSGQLLLNGQVLNEPYLAEPDRPASSSSFEVEVPDNRVFLLGDNRYDSIDSRALLGAPGGGMIQNEKIYGPVISTR
ncbi:signal peptidase I [Enteractinococcus fodinae]